MRTPQERKDEITNLPTEDLRHRLISRGFGELTKFAEAELATREKKESSEMDFRSEKREEQNLVIARKALRNSYWANAIAIFATIIAILSIIFNK